MIPNNNLSVLPFYKSLEKQNHRKSYAFGEVFPLLTPDREVLPFQIIRETRAGNIESVIMKKQSGELHQDITANMVSAGLHINRYESKGYDVIIFPDFAPMGIPTPEGQYYIEVYDGIERWYSEIFTIVRFIGDCLMIQYWDNESLEYPNGKIDYSTGFKHKLYLNTQIGRPEYEFEEQVENRDGYLFVEKQVSEKTFKFNFLAPEYLCDAMRIIRMADNIRVHSLSDNYNVESFLMTPKWQDGGALAAVEIEFQCDTIIKKIGRGFVPVELGDFNIDHDEDFNII